MDDLLLLLFGWPWLRRWFGGQGPAIGAPEEPAAGEILRRRYARGEITREQFDEMRAVLDSNRAGDEAPRRAA